MARSPRAAAGPIGIPSADSSCFDDDVFFSRIFVEHCLDQATSVTRAFSHARLLNAAARVGPVSSPSMWARKCIRKDSRQTSNPRSAMWDKLPG